MANPLVADTSQLTQNLLSLIMNNKQRTREDQLLQQQQKREQDRKKLQVAGAQALELRNLPTFEQKRTGIMRLAQSAIEKGGDPAAWDKMLNIDNVDELNLSLRQMAINTETAGKFMDRNLGGATSAGQREFDQLTKGLSAADKEKARRIKLRLDPGAVGSSAQTIDEKGITTDIAESEAEIKGTIEEEVGTVKGRQQRLNVLRTSRAGRQLSIKKAKRFLDLFKNRNMKSGAGRSAARYLPGVYTDQGKLDEEFGSFAEVAARQALKASGEIRPTDADVVGMKRAMFGIGRDESVNMILLEDYLEQQELDAEEFKALKAGKSPIRPQPAAEKTPDEQALDWAKANPNDPRAIKIMQLQGARNGL